MSDTEQDYTRERAALTRLAEDARGETVHSAYVLRKRDEWYPPRRVRAVTTCFDGEMRLDQSRWQFYTGKLPNSTGNITREHVAAMFALQQRADADGMVTEGEGLGETVGELCKGSSRAGTRDWDREDSEPQQATATAPDYPTVSRAPAPTAPRKWYQYNAAEGLCRPVRPLTAAQVEALAQAMADAWSHVVAASLLPIRSTSTRYSAYMAEARAALAHLGIPVKEVG